MPDREVVPGVARAIAKRRNELELSLNEFVHATGLTRQGLAPLLAGERRRYQERLTMPVCRVLGWAPGSIERLFAGEEPIMASDESNPVKIGPDTRILLDQLAEVGGILSQLEALGVAADQRAAEVDEVIADLQRRVAALEQARRGNG